MTQGEKIKAVRKNLGLTLEKFGEKLGVTKVAIFNIEKGNRGLTEQMAIAICRTYNVNYDWLIHDEGEMFSNAPDTVLDELCMQYELDDMDKMLAELYIGLSEEYRKEVKAHLKSLIRKYNVMEDSQEGDV